MVQRVADSLTGSLSWTGPCKRLLVSITSKWTLLQWAAKRMGKTKSQHFFEDGAVVELTWHDSEAAEVFSHLCGRNVESRLCFHPVGGQFQRRYSIVLLSGMDYMAKPRATDTPCSRHSRNYQVMWMMATCSLTPLIPPTASASFIASPSKCDTAAFNSGLEGRATEA